MIWDIPLLTVLSERETYKRHAKRYSRPDRFFVHGFSHSLYVICMLKATASKFPPCWGHSEELRSSCTGGSIERMQRSRDSPLFLTSFDHMHSS